MRRSGRIFSAGWILLGVVGCTPIEPPAATPAAQADEPGCTVAPDQAPLPVVTIVQTRDHEITVHAGDDGLRFTVSLAGGVLLGHQLSEMEFEHSFPGLHQRYASAFAGDETWLDASLDPLPSAAPSALTPSGLR